jgi:hypothetical protein
VQYNGAKPEEREKRRIGYHVNQIEELPVLDLFNTSGFYTDKAQ